MAQVHFWEWNNRYNHPNLYLGNTVDSLLEKGLIVPGTREGEYFSAGKPSVMVQTIEGEIVSVSFLDVKEIFFIPYVTSKEDVELHPLEFELNQLLNPLDDLNNGNLQPGAYNASDIFLLSYKDEEPSIAMLMRKVVD